MKIAYLCGASFRWELGECDLVCWYDSLEELKEKGECWTNCGVVEVEYDGTDYPKNKEEVMSYKWVIEEKSWSKK
jgi:hypothetical protein